MGLGSSAEISSTTLQIFQILGENDVVEESNYWNQLFNSKLSQKDIKFLQDKIGSIYQKKPYNFHLAIKICALKLREMNQLIPDQIITILVVIRLILPIIISSGCHVAVFNQTVTGKTKLGTYLSFLLFKLLHYPNVTSYHRPGPNENNNRNYETVLKNAKLWYENPNLDESYLNLNRLTIIESLLLLKTSKVPFPEFLDLELDKIEKNANANLRIMTLCIKKTCGSILSTLKYYLNATTKSMFTSIPSIHLIPHLLQATLLLFRLLNIDVVSDDIIQIYKPVISDDDHKFSLEDIQTFALPLLFNLESISLKDDSIIDSSGLPLIIKALTICDQRKDSSSLCALAILLSFPSTAISLNIPCVSFESNKPVHRGSYADIVIEIASRQNISLLQVIVLIIVNVVPYASNLSYCSAIAIFRILSIAQNNNDLKSVKMIISAIHYAINRSVRENVPLVILVMKNSKMLININKELNNLEECEQLVSFVKNVNQELKQLGDRFRSSELEKFFNDPSCEHFALPVLRPPQADFDLSKMIQNQTNVLVKDYIKNETGVQTIDNPNQRS